MKTMEPTPSEPVSSGALKEVEARGAAVGGWQTVVTVVVVMMRSFLCGSRSGGGMSRFAGCQVMSVIMAATISEQMLFLIASGFRGGFVDGGSGGVSSNRETLGFAVGNAPEIKEGG